MIGRRQRAGVSAPRSACASLSDDVERESDRDQAVGERQLIQRWATTLGIVIDLPRHGPLLAEAVALDLHNSPWPNLAEEHRQWLRAFDAQYLSNWEKLLNADSEAALCEASMRRRLQAKGVTVEPNEKLTANASTTKLGRVVVVGGGRYRIALDEAVEEGGEPFKDTTVAPTIVYNGSGSP